MEFQHLLSSGLRCSDVDVAFFADSYLVSEAEDGVAAAVGIEGEVVEAAVSEAIAVVW